MKTKEERNALKKEVEAVGEKPEELSDEDLEKVSGGANVSWMATGIDIQENKEEYVSTYAIYNQFK